MLLRLLVVFLFLANGLYFVWSHGVLGVYGFAPQSQTEPQRLAQQIAPDGIKLLSRQEIKAAEAEAQAERMPPVCLVAGPLDDARKAALTPQLASALPDGSWQWDTQAVPARWIVYMGKFPNADALHKKRNELNGLKIEAEEVHSAALEPGLSLGGFPAQALANAELARLAGRGVHTAHVVQERAEGHTNLLRLPAADSAMQAKLAPIQAVLGAQTLHPCN
jgi:hypothetical protein